MRRGAGRCSNTPGATSKGYTPMPFKFTCERCGEPFTRTNRLRGGKTPHRFCSMSCARKSRPSTSFVAETFFSRVDTTGGDDSCWPWRGARNREGYGFLKVNKRIYLAHRVAFFVDHGHWPIPCACHHCDTPSCCNPNHLFAGSHGDNARDRASKGRGGRYKLTAEDVRTIRRRYEEGSTQRSLAIEYGLYPGTVSDIVHRRLWKHV